jgi:hypothetical protein
VGLAGRQRSQKDETQMAKKQTVAVAVRGRGPDGERTPEQRIEIIGQYLQKMEVVQLQHATGAVLIGLELLALKDQLGHGEFKDVFEKQIERPRFSIRSAQRYMSDANRIRRKLIKGDAVSLAGILNISPSALPMAQQAKLQAIIADAVGNRSLSGLRGALGNDKPKQIADGKGPATGKEAELEAHAAVWNDLCKRLTDMAVHKKTWKFLNVDTRRIVREMIETALAEIPK